MDGFEMIRVGLRIVTCAVAITVASAAGADQRPSTPGLSNQVAVAQSSGSVEMVEAERALLESLTARKAGPQAAKPLPVANTAQAAKPGSSEKEVKGPTLLPVKAAAVDTAAKKLEVVENKTEVLKSIPVAPALIDEALSPPKPEPAPAKAMLKPEAAAGPSKPSSDSRTITTLRAQNSHTKDELRQTQARVDQLLSELDTLRSQLATAEMEVNRLSGLVDAKNRNALNKYSIAVPASVPDSARRQAAPAARTRDNDGRGLAAPHGDIAAPESGSSLPVATVVVEKADLRLGPGRNNSALMSVSKGSRLLVEARQGEWYRVFAPSGERAWVNSSAVIFGEIPGPSNGTATRVKGYDADLEEEAFRKFNSSSGE